MSSIKKRPGRLVDAARAALRANRWSEAVELLQRADPDDLEPADLDAYAQAAWWTGRLQLAIEIRERAFNEHLKRGDQTGAAAVALAMANDHAHRLESSLAGGWVRRAERLLQGEPESRAHGLLERARINAAAGRGEFDTALGHADRLLAIGQRLGDRDLEVLGLHDRGRLLVSIGQVDEGLALLDEAIVSAISGELEPHATAVVYCNATIACQDLADYRRAVEWAEAAKRWCERQEISGFPGMCRVRRVEVMRLRGSWAEAESEAARACEELQEFCLDYAGEGFYQIGEIRLRMGDYPAAEQAFRQAHQLARPPLPGLAMLRLAQGRPDEAADLLSRALADAALPKLSRARLLAADVEVALDRGELEHAQRAAAELRELADTFATHALRASATLADGAVALAAGEAEQAVEALRRAWRLWQETDAPYEAAQARARLGDALAAAGDTAGGEMERRAALSVLEQLGARAEADRLARALGPEQTASIGTVERRTFLFSDIVDSTRLIETIGDEAWGGVLAWHDRILRELIRSHGGEEIDHAGDGFFVAFSAPDSALDAAVAIQRALAQHRVEHGFAPRVRIGVHADEALKAGHSYEGRGVHLAARIAGAAAGDEILASESTVTAAGAEYPVGEAREASLKGIGEPVRLVSVRIRPEPSRQIG